MTETPGNPERLFDRIDVDILPGETGELQGTGVIATEGLGPCLGICIYDPESRQAFLAHLPSLVHATTGELDEFLEAVTTATPGSRSRAWLGGMEPYEGDESNVDAIRQNIVERIHEVVRPDIPITTRWAALNEAVSYALDVETGQESVEVDVDPDPPPSPPF